VSRSWIIDKSAFARLANSPDLPEWINRISRGLVFVHPLTLLEIGFSARSGEDWRKLMTRVPISDLIEVEVTQVSLNRAQQLQGMLAERGYHRAASPIDLAIAATAELSSMTILHVDKDFELIAEITGQPLERLRYSGE